MTEKQRLQHLMIDVQDRIKRMGTNTKIRWVNFHENQPVSRDEFFQIVSKWNLTDSISDLECIWESIAPNNDRMSYPDFMRFMTMDNVSVTCPSNSQMGQAPPPAYQSPDPAYNQPMQQLYQAPNQQPQTEKLSKTLLDNKSQIAQMLISHDPNCDGYVPSTTFKSIVVSIRPNVNQGDFAQIIDTYSLADSGYINYFLMLGDLVAQLPPPTSYDAKPQFRRAPQPTFPEEPVAQPQRRVRQEPGGPDLLNFDPPMQQQPQQRFVQPSQDNRGGNLQALMANLSKRIGEQFDSGTGCFQRWRGYSERIGVQELMNGARKDIGIDLSADEAQSIINSLGGPLNLGSFMKLLNIGSGEAQSLPPERLEDMSEDDKIIHHIARQAHGKQWDVAFNSSDGPEELVKMLKQVGVFVLITDLRPLYNKIGKEQLFRRISDVLRS